VHVRYRVPLLDDAASDPVHRQNNNVQYCVPRRQQLDVLVSTLQLLAAITHARQCSRADFMTPMQDVVNTVLSKAALFISVG